jgi:hypothetical protein
MSEVPLTLSALAARVSPPILWMTILHALLSVGCLVALGLESSPIMGVHPALKPLKFAVSITIFLATIGVLLPSIATSPAVRSALAWVFATTMAIEMLVIVAQAVRKTTSHFNVGEPMNRAAWGLMVSAIVVASIAMACVALLASILPLTDGNGRAMHPVLAFAWRAGLWILLLAPLSGFAMGARLQHSIGGPDGGPGLPFVNWSVIHGDLRVAHFFALHALQVLPILAWMTVRTITARSAQWGVVSITVIACVVTCLVALGQAFAGRPFIARAPSSHQ